MKWNDSSIRVAQIVPSPVWTAPVQCRTDHVWKIKIIFNNLAYLILHKIKQITLNIHTTMILVHCEISRIICVIHFHLILSLSLRMLPIIPHRSHSINQTSSMYDIPRHMFQIIRQQYLTFLILDTHFIHCC